MSRRARAGLSIARMWQLKSAFAVHRNGGILPDGEDQKMQNAVRPVLAIYPVPELNHLRMPSWEQRLFRRLHRPIAAAAHMHCPDRSAGAVVLRVPPREMNESICEATRRGYDEDRIGICTHHPEGSPSSSSRASRRRQLADAL